MNDSKALAKCITCLLDSTTPGGTWGDFQVEWDPIITALTCKLLLGCGLSVDGEWYVQKHGYTRSCLRNSLHWLNNAIRPDGSFGTDFWDALQLGILIEEFHLQPEFSAYQTLEKHLLTQLRSGRYLNDGSQWQGPGFTAAGVQYAFLKGLGLDVADLTHRLLNLQTSKGSWCAAPDSTGTHVISPVWHTAQCVMALAHDPRKHAVPIKKACAWLSHSQDKSGAWISVQQYKIYFTSYAVLAFTANAQHGTESVQRAIDFLKSQMAEDGKCSDLGGTLMCAMALRAVAGKAFEHDLTLVDYLLARKNCTRAEALAQTVSDQKKMIDAMQLKLNEYQAKYADADIVFTKKQFFMVTMMGFLLTALGTVVGFYGLFVAFRPATQVIQPATQSTRAVPAPGSEKQGGGRVEDRTLQFPKTSPPTLNITKVH